MQPKIFVTRLISRPSLPLAVALLAAWASIGLCAEKISNYSDKEFGFRLQYPASWRQAPSPVPNLRIKITAPANTPGAECSVIVKRYPNAVAAKQSDIDQVFLESPTTEELEDVLSQGGGTVRVVDASVGRLHSRPAHVARVQYRAGNDGYGSGRVMMTATPGLTWSVCCAGQGRTPAEADKNFQHWEKQINGFFASFRFK